MNAETRIKIHRQKKTNPFTPDIRKWLLGIRNGVVAAFSGSSDSLVATSNNGLQPWGAMPELLMQVRFHSYLLPPVQQCSLPSILCSNMLRHVISCSGHTSRFWYVSQQPEQPLSLSHTLETHHCFGSFLLDKEIHMGIPSPIPMWYKFRLSPSWDLEKCHEHVLPNRRCRKRRQQHEILPLYGLQDSLLLLPKSANVLIGRRITSMMCAKRRRVSKRRRGSAKFCNAFLSDLSMPEQ